MPSKVNLFFNSPSFRSLSISIVEVLTNFATDSSIILYSQELLSSEFELRVICAFSDSLASCSSSEVAIVTYIRYRRVRIITLHRKVQELFLTDDVLLYAYLSLF